MRNKILFAMFFSLTAIVTKAQNNDHKMSDTQKEQAAKADVFIINSQKKVVDSFTIAGKDSVTTTKKLKNRPCLKRNKKAPERGAFLFVVIYIFYFNARIFLYQ